MWFYRVPKIRKQKEKKERKKTVDCNKFEDIAKTELNKKKLEENKKKQEFVGHGAKNVMMVQIM